MIIREATEDDIPEIISVLKLSLGEVSSKKTEEVWRYKHIDNPFGKSLVLVATIEGVIIGVRAFMQWKWMCDKKVFQAYRAVDTATHPEHRGKGIFKKLTLEALDRSKERGVEFIFNTPNEQSKPGYLKMGWKELGKLPIKVIPVVPFRRGIDYSLNCNIESCNKLLEVYNLRMESEGRLYTKKTIDFLKWRYENCVLQNYKILCSEDFFVAMYEKNHSKFRELRVSELIIDENFNDKLLKSMIRRIANESKVQVITFSDKIKLPNMWGVSGEFGPILTFKNVNLDHSGIQQYSLIDNWAYSTGDLELF